jgi:hypothetical protein
MPIRAFNHESDYPNLVKWWTGHHATILAVEVLPRGWVVTAGGVDIACAFMLVDVDGKWAVMEFLTTNPSVAFSRHLVADIRALAAHIEAVAIHQGCTFILSFVGADTGEERLMKGIGYLESDGKRHKIFAKSLVTKEGA